MSSGSHRITFFAISGSILAILAACSGAHSNDTSGSSGGQGTASANVGQFCGSYCARVNSCDNGNDQQTCANSCTNKNAATFPKLRSDVVGLMVSCLQSRDCKTVLEANVINTCASEAAAQVAPSAAATNFCDAAKSTSTKCSRSFDKAACLNNAKLFNDSALEDAGSCLKKSCTDIDECVNAALGGGSSVSVDNGPDDGNGGTGSSSGGTTGGTTTCSSQSCPTGGQMQVCTTTDSHGACTAMTYKVNGQTFACESCGNCSTAQTNATNACAGGSGSSSSGGSTCSIDPRFQIDHGGTCDTCMGNTCCGQIQGCSTDWDCSALTDCLSNCQSGDSNCQQSCASSYQNGVSKFQAIQSCYKSCQSAGSCQ